MTLKCVELMSDVEANSGVKVNDKNTGTIGRIHFGKNDTGLLPIVLHSP